MRLNVKAVASAKGYQNAKVLGEAAGIQPTSIYRIWNGTASRVDLATLDKLCKLLDVPVGMLLEYIPDELIGSGSSAGAASVSSGTPRPRRSGPSSKKQRARGSGARAAAIR